MGSVIKEKIKNEYCVGDLVSISYYTSDHSTCVIREIKENGIIVQGEYGLGYTRFEDIKNIEHKERNSYIRKLNIQKH